MTQARSWRILAAVGGVAWLILLAAASSGVALSVDPLDRMLLLAIDLVAPLAMGLILDDSPLARVLPFLYAPAALAGSLSLVVVKGNLAGALAGVWLLFTLCLAVTGLLRAWAAGISSLAELSISIGLIYSPIGALWLAAARIGMRPLGFIEPVVTLTAVHFHFISLGALTLVGLAGREYDSTAFRASAAGMIVGPLLVAAGISLSRAVEVAGAGMVISAALMLAWIMWVRLAPLARSGGARILFRLSALCAVASMLLAGAYALSRVGAPWSIGVPFMAQTHGWLNGLGFVGAGLLAWQIEERS